MAGKSYSVVQRLSGAILARLKGEEHASKELKVDRATVRRWLKSAPDDPWRLSHDLAAARLQEQLATGKLSAVTLATVQGVAARNLRYGELLRQREQRKATEANGGDGLDDPAWGTLRYWRINARIAEMPPECRDLARAEKALHAWRARYDPKHVDATILAFEAAIDLPEDGHTMMDRWLTEISSLSDEEVTARREAVDAENRRWQEQNLERLEQERLEAIAQLARRPGREDPPPTPAEKPAEPPRVLSERVPLDVHRLKRTSPVVVAIPAGEHLDGQRGWHPADGRDRW